MKISSGSMPQTPLNDLGLTVEQESQPLVESENPVWLTIEGSLLSVDLDKCRFQKKAELAAFAHIPSGMIRSSEVP